MDQLLIYDEAQVCFDAAEIENVLRSIPAISSVRTTPQVIAVVEGDYEHETGTAIIRLISTRKMIVLEGTFEAIASAAFELSESTTRKLRLIDESYNFDIAFEDVSSLQQLQEKLAAATE